MSTSPENPAPPERFLTSEEVRIQVKESLAKKGFWKRCYGAVRKVIRDTWDGILYRTLFRYHIVDLHVKPGHYDIDFRMLHACFQLLVEFVELEKPDKWWGWTEQEPIWVEIRELYDWWKNRRPKRRTPLDDIDSVGPPIADTTGVCMSYEDALKKSTDLQNEWANEDNQMLARLIKVRENLWT